MTASVVQSCQGAFAFGGVSPLAATATFGANVTHGNAIVVGWVFRDTANTAPSGYTFTITDSRSTSYSQTASFNFWNTNISRNSVCLLYAGTVPSTGANTVTATISTGLTLSKGGAIFALEVSGLYSLASEGTGTGSRNNAAAFNYFLNNSGISYTTPAPFLMTVWDAVQSTNAVVGFVDVSATPIYDSTSNDLFFVAYDFGNSVTSPWTCTWNQNPAILSGYTGLGAAYPEINPHPGGGQTLVSVIACCS